jgi:hypothetical protein
MTHTKQADKMSRLTIGQKWPVERIALRSAVVYLPGVGSILAHVLVAGNGIVGCQLGFVLLSKFIVSEPKRLSSALARPG